MSNQTQTPELKTFKEVLESIPDKKAAKKAVQNTEADILGIKNKHHQTPSAALHGAFSWNQTPEGHDYWSKVCSDLMNLEEGQAAKNDPKPKRKTMKWTLREDNMIKRRLDNRKEGESMNKIHKELAAVFDCTPNAVERRIAKLRQIADVVHYMMEATEQKATAQKWKELAEESEKVRDELLEQLHAQVKRQEEERNSRKKYKFAPIFGKLFGLYIRVK